jgi:hypothetical protein
MLEPIRDTFRAVAQAVVPETRHLAPQGWAALEATVERALAARPAPVQKQLILFLRAVEYLGIARHRARFSRLPVDQATSLLQWLERSPVLLIRRGVWGLRTLVMMGYYTQPAIQHEIGYRAHPDGWLARRRSGEHPAITDVLANS